MTTTPSVAVLGLKGGIGKTTVALGLTSAARARGKRVLYVDLDPQNNGTDVIAHPKYLQAVKDSAGRPREAPMSLVDLLEMTSPTAADLQKAMYPARPEWSGVHVLPATLGLERIERSDPGVMNTFSALMEHARPLVDLIVCDCRPAMNMLTTMGARESEVILAVCEPERFGVQGLSSSWVQLKKLMANNGLPRMRDAAAVVTQHDENLQEHRTRLGEIRKAFGPVMWEEVLPRRQVVSQATSAGKPIHDYQHQRQQDATKVLDAWLDRVLEKAA